MTHREAWYLAGSRCRYYRATAHIACTMNRIAAMRARVRAQIAALRRLAPSTFLGEH